MFENLVQNLLGLIDAFGYFGIFLLMTIESSFIPFPSEVVVPPAAYLAAQGKMSISLVILFAVLGSLAGALINYYLAMWLGRPLIFALVQKKWAKMFLLNKAKVEKAERYFLKYGSLSTFLGRLVPAVRQLISLPAGFTKMPLKPFLLFTTLGATLWICVLAALGYFFGAKQDLLMRYYKEVTLGSIALVVIVIVVVYFMRRKRRRSH